MIEQERQKAEQERQKAEQERQKAEQKDKELVEERQKLLVAVNNLRKMNYSNQKISEIINLPEDEIEKL